MQTVIPEGGGAAPIAPANLPELRPLRGGIPTAKAEITMTNKPSNETIANIESAALETVAGGCGSCKNNTTIINNYGPRWGGPPPGYYSRGRGWGGGMSVSTTTSIG